MLKFLGSSSTFKDIHRPDLYQLREHEANDTIIEVREVSAKGLGHNKFTFRRTILRPDVPIQNKIKNNYTIKVHFEILIWAMLSLAITLKLLLIHPIRLH